MRRIVREQSSVAKFTGRITLLERERERERERDLGMYERTVWEMDVYRLSNYQCLQKDPVP